MHTNKRLLQWFEAFKTHELTPVISMTLGVKLALWLIGVTVFAVVTQQQQLHLGDIAAIANHWDAPHYISIAQNGYQGSGPDRFLVAFFPLFPWVVRVFASFVGDYIWSALLASTICSLLMSIMFYKLVRLDWPVAVARRAVWWLLIFPTAYFPGRAPT